MVHLRFDEFQELSLLRTLFLTFLETAQCMSKFQLSREVNRAVSKTIHGEFCPGYGCEELFSSTNLDRLDLSQQVTYIPLYTSVLSTFMSVFLGHAESFFFPSIMFYHPPTVAASVSMASCFPWPSS